MHSLTIKTWLLEEKFLELCHKVSGGSALKDQDLKDFKMFLKLQSLRCSDLPSSTESSHNTNCRLLEEPVKMNPNMSPVNDMISIMATTYGTRAATIPKGGKHLSIFLLLLYYLGKSLR